MEITDAMAVQAVSSLAEKLMAVSAAPSRKYILGGNVTATGDNGMYRVKTAYGGDDDPAYNRVASPIKAISPGTGVLVGNVNGDCQDVVILGMSGYYYP